VEALAGRFVVVIAEASLYALLDQDEPLGLELRPQLRLEPPGAQQELGE